nr:hypothetical protein [Tanacetum cinerariifolium]
MSKWRCYIEVTKEKLKEARSRQKVMPTSIGSLVREYPLDKIREDLSCEEEVEAILAREERIMRRKTIPFVKVLWKNHSEREATWELEESIRERMAPKRRSTSAASTSKTPAMTQAVIRQLIADGVTAALELQAATIANTNRMK